MGRKRGLNPLFLTLSALCGKVAAYHGLPSAGRGRNVWGVCNVRGCRLIAVLTTFLPMIRHGEAPYLECSSKGDKRFSAFFAFVEVAPGGYHSIESHYQAAKVFEDGSDGFSWRDAKGRKAMNQEAVAKLYAWLWDIYIDNHPELQQVLMSASGLSDMFGQAGHVCQATELWRIRCKLLNQPKG